MTLFPIEPWSRVCSDMGSHGAMVIGVFPIVSSTEVRAVVGPDKAVLWDVLSSRSKPHGRAATAR